MTTTRRLAWGIWAITIALAGAALVLLEVAWHAPTPEGQFGFRGFAVMFALTFGTVGALVASRHPSNPLGWIFLTVGLLSGVQEFANEYAIYGILGNGGDLPLRDIAAWIPSWIWIPATSGALYLLLLFPDGRPLSPAWRPVVAVGVVGTLIGSVGAALHPGPLENFSPVENPFGVGSRTALGVISAAGIFIYGVAFILSATSLVIRFRRSRADERQQLKWLASSGVFLSFALVTSFITQVSHPKESLSATQSVSFGVALVVILGFGSLPIATGIAILKHRLFDIDVVINKTVVYGTLAVFIALVYVSIVAGVGAVVGSRGSSFLSAVAAAVVALAFQPARRSAQHLANPLVYGTRASPYEVLSQLSDRMAGTYSIDDVLPRIARSLGEGTGASSVTTWLRVGNLLRPVSSWPSTVEHAPVAGISELPDEAFEVRHQGETLGAITVAMPPKELMTPTLRKLAGDLAAQAGLVLRNVRLFEELQDSRRRIVASQDERAQKLERDLHDGAQQQLVALTVKLRLLEQTAERDPTKTREIAAELRGEAGEALENLRDLARGIYPPLLADKGLGAALQAQARKSAIPVVVEADGVGRFPQDVEAAVYFSCLEALQNVAKYAGATCATVALSDEGEALRFEVSDEGAGFDPGAITYGTGLQGVSDRLAALGGELRIESDRGAGTRVIGSLPAEARS